MIGDESMITRNSCKWVFVFLGWLLLTNCCWAGDFKVNSFSETKLIRNKVLASHFLMRTTFGPTMPEIDALAERIGAIGHRPALEEWIDSQFGDYPLSANWQEYQADRGRLWPLAKKMLQDMGYEQANFGRSDGAPDFGVFGRNQFKEYAWWHRKITAKDQLRQRMAWALSQIFVTGEGPDRFSDRPLDSSANPRWLGLPKYYDDVCIANAFGNYRSLLDSMTYHPVMGVWLTSVRNQKADPNTGTKPDENYAREIMQLFSIGVVELNPDGTTKLGPDGQPIETYDNETISALARVFTGLVYDNNNPANDSRNAGTNLHAPMEMYEQDHDFDQKVAFGGALVISAKQSTDIDARLDISEVHDFLAYKHENTAPFLCRRLIQRFVMSNPPRDYLRRVSYVFNENRGNPFQFREVIKAILLDKIALSGIRFQKIRNPRGLRVTRAYDTEGTRLREPLLRFVAMIRTFSPYPDSSFVTHNSGASFFTPGGPEGEAGNQYFFIDNDSLDIDDDIGQTPFESPSVFNFYSPDYEPTGVLSTYTPSSAIATNRLKAPEFQILTPVTSNELMNEFRKSVIDDDLDVGEIQVVSGQTATLDLQLNYEEYFEDGGMLGPDGTEPTTAQLEDFLESLDLRLCAGTMNTATRTHLLNVCQSEIDQYNVQTVSNKRDLVRAIISVVLQSPDSAVIP